jgi:nicotinate-nucleotide pyrophosphorylase
VIRLVPSARAAIRRARIVWDFEPGIEIEPDNFVDRTEAYIFGV